LSWSAEDRALVVRSGRTRLARRIDRDAVDLVDLVARLGSKAVSVFVESLAVEASWTPPEVPPKRPRRPPPEPPPPAREPSAPSEPPATGPADPAPPDEARPPEPVPLPWPAGFAARRSPPPSSPTGAGPVRLTGETAVRFRSPGAWAPSFSVRAAFRPGPRRRGDRWSLFVRARGSPPTRARVDGFRLDVWSFGGDFGFGWAWLRVPGWRSAFEAGATVEALGVRELRAEGGDVDRDGVVGGAFAGPTLTVELGRFELGAFASGFVFPTGLTLRKEDDEARLERFGFRGGASIGWRF